MTTVFSHGRLRLYLLKLLDDGPKHGYELIRLLEDRFLGLYAPSAGTVYPRLRGWRSRAGHPHRRGRPQGLRDHRRGPGGAARSGPVSWPRWNRTSASVVEDLSGLAGGSARERRGARPRAGGDPRQTRRARRVGAPPPAGGAPGRRRRCSTSSTSGSPRSPPRSGACPEARSPASSAWSPPRCAPLSSLRRLLDCRFTGLSPAALAGRGPAGRGTGLPCLLSQFPALAQLRFSRPDDDGRMPATQTEARLLVVEDDPNILELLSASLRFAGFDVATATSGSDAVTAAARRTAPIWSCST